MKPQLVKKPAESPTETAARTAERDAIADEYGPLDLEVKTLSTRLRVLTAEDGTYNRLKDEIRSWFSEKAPDAKFLYESDKYLLEVSANEQETTPLKKKIYRALGATAFVELANVTQKAVREALEARKKPALFDAFFSRARTGKRSVAALPKAADEAA